MCNTVVRINSMIVSLNSVYIQLSTHLIESKYWSSEKNKFKTPSNVKYTIFIYNKNVIILLLFLFSEMLELSRW